MEKLPKVPRTEHQAGIALCHAFYDMWKAGGKEPTRCMLLALLRALDLEAQLAASFPDAAAFAHWMGEGAEPVDP